MASFVMDDDDYVGHCKKVVKKLRDDIDGKVRLMDIHMSWLLSADNYTRVKFEYEMTVAKMHLEEALKIADDILKKEDEELI